MDNRPIGVFDSGVGGLTTVRELKKILPGEDIVYLGDTGRVPYGTHGRDIIIKYALDNIRFMLRSGVKMIISACGTVSSTLPSDVIAGLPVPFTGVVGPAALAACAATKTGKIGVVGTSATIRSGSFPLAIKTISPGAQVTAKACPLLVPLVENGMIGPNCEVTRLVVQDYLASVKEVGVDTLILGCTHYPLLYSIIDNFLGGNVALIDSGRETALWAKDFLTEKEILAGPGREGSTSYFVTDTVDSFISTAETFMGIEIRGSVNYIDIDDM